MISVRCCSQYGYESFLRLLKFEKYIFMFKNRLYFGLNSRFNRRFFNFFGICGFKFPKVIDDFFVVEGDVAL